LYGRGGALQEAWSKASIAENQPIVNDIEHQLEVDAKEALMEAAKQHRVLTKERYNAIKAAAPEDKMAVRKSFNEAEINIIEKSFIIKQKINEHHYSARNDVDSIRYQIACENNYNERNAALVMVANRGLSLATITANQKVLAAKSRVASKDRIAATRSEQKRIVTKQKKIIIVNKLPKLILNKTKK